MVFSEPIRVIAIGEGLSEEDAANIVRECADDLPVSEPRSLLLQSGHFPAWEDPAALVPNGVLVGEVRVAMTQATWGSFDAWL